MKSMERVALQWAGLVVAAVITICLVRLLRGNPASIVERAYIVLGWFNPLRRAGLINLGVIIILILPSVIIGTIAERKRMDAIGR